MKMIIVPIAHRLVAEVGIHAGTTLVRRIDRNLRGTAALEETVVPGAVGVAEFIARIQADPAKSHFTQSLAWLTAQQP